MAATISLLCGSIASAQPSDTAEKIAAGIRKAGFKRVAVMPFVLEEDLRAEQRIRAQGGAANAVAPGPSLSTSFHSRLLPERMETSLAEAAAGDFSLVPCSTILTALENGATGLGAQRRGEGEVAGLVKGLGTEAEALVVGSLKTRLAEANGPQGPALTFAMEDVAWKLVGLDDSTIKAAASATTFTSLADAVYRGQSGEFFRWDGDRLRVLFMFDQRKRNAVPLEPSDGNDLFSTPDRNDDLNPILNPHCPYKVRFEFDGTSRPLIHPVDEKPARIVGGPNKTFAHWGGNVFLPIEPGEGPVIKVTNTSAKPAMVAVFIDGVNILGKKRELPDQRCAVWKVAPRAEGIFRGWYSGTRGDEQVEPFVVEPWERSVAGKLGLGADTDQARAITIVVFTEGWPDRKNLAFFERPWMQDHSWDPQRSLLAVKEGLVPAGSAGAAADIFGMGGLKPEPGKLQWVKGQPQGTILAAMTVWYGPQGDMPRIMARRLKGMVGFSGSWTAVKSQPAGR